MPDTFYTHIRLKKRYWLKGTENYGFLLLKNFMSVMMSSYHKVRHQTVCFENILDDSKYTNVQ